MAKENHDKSTLTTDDKIKFLSKEIAQSKDNSDLEYIKEGILKDINKCPDCPTKTDAIKLLAQFSQENNYTKNLKFIVRAGFQRNLLLNMYFNK